MQANLSWELDLFGRVRRGIEAQSAETWATAADLDALQVAIVGEVARSYVELRGLQERLRVAHGNADNQRETLRLVQARFEPVAAPSSTPRQPAPSWKPRCHGCRRWKRRWR